MTPEEMNLAAHHLLSNEHSMSLIGSSNGSIFESNGLGGVGGGRSSISGAFGGSASGPSSFTPMHQASYTLQSPPIPDNRLRRVATITTTNNKSQPSQYNLNSSNNDTATLISRRTSTPTQHQQLQKLQSPHRHLRGTQSYSAAS